MATLAPLPRPETLESPAPLEEERAPQPQRRRVEAGPVWIWLLSASLVLYLGINGGGYDLVVRNDAGVVVWWILLAGAAFGVLPAARFSRAGWAAVALFGGFVLWNAIAATWSLSSERSLQEVSRLACYFGVLVLALATFGDRRRALRHVVAAVASALVVIIVLALLSRLRPGMLGSGQTAALLPGSTGRLNWPLNYWNALAALVALAVPLLLALATSARTFLAQAAAAAAIPAAALCGYLTFSRGGALAAGVAIVVFIALAPERIPKLATLLVSGAASALLILDASHRAALEHGLNNVAARHEGATLLTALIAACALVGLAQVGIRQVARYARPRRLLTVPRRHARVLLAVGIVIGLVGLLAFHAPTHLSHAWRDFKSTSGASGPSTSIGRFATLNGEGRYDYWKAAVHAMPGHWVGGSGPGTFQLLWLPRAPFMSYVINAHSLYVETLAEVGLVGLALLAGFIGVLLLGSLRRILGARRRRRTEIAAVVGATCAFLVSATFDWVWQVPVLPVAVLLLGAGVLAGDRMGARVGDATEPRRETPPAPRWAGWALRAGIVAIAAGCLLAIGVPLAATSSLRQSQAAVRSGDSAAALADAQAAIRVEPGAASAELQAALVLEFQRRFDGAVAYARAATRDEPANWQTWLVRSRIEAEAGHPALAVTAYRRARSLNPRSPIFNA